MNCYDSIKIDDGKINFSNKSGLKPDSQNNQVSYNFNGRSDEEIIDMVLEHYLNHSCLTSIYENYIHNKKKFVYLEGSRTFQSSVSLTEKQSDKIISKYSEDRLRSLSDIPVSRYNFSKSEVKSSYDIDLYKGCADIVIQLGDDLFWDFEIDFLERFLPILFRNNKMEIVLDYVYLMEGTECDKKKQGFYIIGSDKIIKLHASLLYEAMLIINKHNSELEENKKEML